MLVKIVARCGEVVIEWAALRAVDVGPVAVESDVGGGLTFAYVLAVFA